MQNHADLRQHPILAGENRMPRAITMPCPRPGRSHDPRPKNAAFAA